MAQLSKGKRISGDLRTEVRESFVARYLAGESIRSIASDSGRSYGFVQGLLKQAGVEFRSRGGARVRGGAVTPSAARATDAGHSIGEDGDQGGPPGSAGVSLSTAEQLEKDEGDRSARGNRSGKDREDKKD